MRAGEFIQESINPDITNPRFTHTQDIGDYTYKATVDVFLFDPILYITAYDGRKKIGHTMFELFDWETPNEGWMESGGTLVDPSYRGKGVAYAMYAYAKMLGNDINPSFNQTDMGKKMWSGWKKSGDANHLMTEDATATASLNQLYRDNFPDRDERIWDVIGTHEMDKPLTIQTMPKHRVQIMLLSQYRAEHLDDIVDMMDEDQKAVLQHYMNEPTLSDQVIVTNGSEIIDGNHRALAAAFNGVSIKYVDLVELDKVDELDEEVNPDMFSGPFKHHQEIGEYDLFAKYLNNTLYITCKLEGELAGQVEFEVKNKRGSPSHLESDLTLVYGKYQKRGIASLMYAYAKMLGNDIKPSSRQLAGGKAMWDAWKKSGDAKHLVGESELDPRGWGAVPQSIDIDYFGLQVQMRPSMFLKLALPLEANAENSEVAAHMERGGKIAYPWLDIAEPQEWEDGDFSKEAKVRTHEGRNRMKKWVQMKGDAPIQVNIFFKNANRRKFITPDMITKLSQGVYGESGQWVNGPLFDPRTAQ